MDHPKNSMEGTAIGLWVSDEHSGQVFVLFQCCIPQSMQVPACPQASKQARFRFKEKSTKQTLHSELGTFSKLLLFLASACIIIPSSVRKSVNFNSILST